MDLDFLLQNYLEHDPLRVYSEGDYALRYHPSYGSICLYKASEDSISGDFNKSDWLIETCEPLGKTPDRGKSAKYLGNCVSNITYASKAVRKENLPALPQFADTFFDNITYI